MKWKFRIDEGERDFQFAVFNEFQLYGRNNNNWQCSVGSYIELCHDVHNHHLVEFSLFTKKTNTIPIWSPLQNGLRHLFCEIKCARFSLQNDKKYIAEYQVFQRFVRFNYAGKWFYYYIAPWAYARFHFWDYLAIKNFTSIEDS